MFPMNDALLASSWISLFFLDNLAVFVLTTVDMCLLFFLPLATTLISLNISFWNWPLWSFSEQNSVVICFFGCLHLTFRFLVQPIACSNHRIKKKGCTQYRRLPALFDVKNFNRTTGKNWWSISDFQLWILKMTCPDLSSIVVSKDYTFAVFWMF